MSPSQSIFNLMFRPSCFPKMECSLKLAIRCCNYEFKLLNQSSNVSGSSSAILSSCSSLFCFLLNNGDCMVSVSDIVGTIESQLKNLSLLKSYRKHVQSIPSIESSPNASFFVNLLYAFSVSRIVCLKEPMIAINFSQSLKCQEGISHCIHYEMLQIK